MKTKTLAALLLLWMMLPAPAVQAQRGIAFRFGTSFNHFYRADFYPLIDGGWSNMVIGTYYQEYFSNGGVQAGLNLIYKSNTDKGFPNFPVVMDDFNGDHNVGVTALELDFKAGPRLGPVNPKIGLLFGYWFKRDGFIEDSSDVKLNRYYLLFPLALSAQLPTGYGSVGFGLSYDVGLSNILKNPDPSTITNYNGSRVRGIRIEITVLFGFRRQAPKEVVPEPLPE